MNVIYPESIRTKAEQQLAALGALKSQPAWKHYIIPRLQELEASAKEAVFADDIDQQEREIRFRIWKSVKEIAQFPETDERSARKIVEG